MMNSLFSSFDPMTIKLQLNWMMLISPMIILPMSFWIKKSRIMMIKEFIENKMIMELKNITHHKEILIITMSIFFFIFTINIMGLVPYVFTPTSHISISASMALPLWISMMIYSWMNFTNNMLSHLLPKGTPVMIMPMMIIIEIAGNIIRPISLSVRLTANMIAGHLMMTLLGNLNATETLIFILPIQTFFMMFESSIAIIQAYVFTTLSTLYSSEIPYG